MKAALEKELSALTLEEKNEVFTYLVPFIMPVDDFIISPELMTELNRRIEEDDKFPETAISLDQFRSHWSHRK